ncbi:glycosyltransferase family 2 protein [Jeotgalicoccus halotolerans]|uniref:4,4'-diaponeurosporenoate glycosyltransferase n=1 Tax=Jeotgalicoccus halotolerans TaxID=157227 RepID=A0A3E0AUD2_9STAP|nr:glycosyltransferase family 2 protein [Jeotgalicoccus halotolerans]REG23358.1 4,4'-diaponeurosporenoate glycosyltransferase [Jeotgalicoccus halotolerans]
MIQILVFIFILIGITGGRLVFFNPKFVTQTNINTVKNAPISIIIPAKNEAGNLTSLITSILQQTAQCEIIVVNDASDDDTSAVLKNYDVLEVKLRENPWKGKSFVCYKGVEYASHELIIFIDADIVFTDNRALEQMISLYAKQNNSGVLSIQPRHRTKRLYEKLSTVFNLTTVMGINVFSAFKSLNTLSTVFGPVLMTNQRDYKVTGGHKASKAKIIEGEGIFTAYQKNSLPVKLFLAGDSIGMRMYPNGLKELSAGWSKHIARGSTNTHPIHMAMIILFLGCGITAFSFLLISLIVPNISVIFALAAYILYGIVFYFLADKVIRLNVIDIFIFPLYIVFFFIIYGLSWYNINIKKQVIWKGQQIAVKDDND